MPLCESLSCFFLSLLSPLMLNIVDDPGPCYGLPRRFELINPPIVLNESVGTELTLQCNISFRFDVGRTIQGLDSCFNPPANTIPRHCQNLTQLTLSRCNISDFRECEPTLRSYDTCELITDDGRLLLQSTFTISVTEALNETLFFCYPPPIREPSDSYFLYVYETVMGSNDVNNLPFYLTTFILTGPVVVLIPIFAIYATAVALL